jgi:serine protease Do
VLSRISSLALIALLLAAVAACSKPNAVPSAAAVSAETSPTSAPVAVVDQASPIVVDRAAPDETGGVTPKADLLGAEGQTYTTVEVVKMLKPSVVQVLTEVVGIDIFGMAVPDTGVGTGIILDTDGHILTNNHVVANAQAIVVTLNNGESREASVVGTDPITDLAVIKVVGNALTPAHLGTSATLEVGEDVIAIGHALGLPGGPTVSKGVVSALGRTIQTDARTTIVDLIQTDTSINPGNSGGPLANMRGEIIGINTAIVQSGQGIGFAINIDDAKVVAAQLIESGMVRRGFLGIRQGNLTPALANYYGVPVTEGIIVGGSVPGTGAADIGLREGDVIIQLGDSPIRSTGDLSKFLLKHLASETVKIVYYRGSQKLTDEIRVSERPSGP